MTKDAVDDILEQWSEERPELDTASLGIVLRVTSLSRTFTRHAGEALEPLDLELFEYDVLSALRRQGKPYSLTASRLAKATGLSSGAMTNRIDRLEERALVRRRPDPDDRRGVIVALTRSGRATIEQAVQLRLDAADDSLSMLSATEKRRLAGLLRKVKLADDSG